MNLNLSQFLYLLFIESLFCTILGFKIIAMDITSAIINDDKLHLNAIYCNIYLRKANKNICSAREFLLLPFFAFFKISSSSKRLAWIKGANRKTSQMGTCMHLIRLLSVHGIHYFLSVDDKI